MARAMLNKFLIQFSVDGPVPSLLFDLRPNSGGGNADNGDLLPKVLHTHCCTECRQHCNRPPPTHACTRDSWTLMGKAGSVYCRVTAPFTWVLVHTRFCLGPPSVLCIWWFYGGVMVASSNRAYVIPRSTALRAPAPAAVHC